MSEPTGSRDEKEEAKSLAERRREAREKGEEKGAMMREYLYTSTTGMEVGVGIAMGAIAGWWLDGKYDTAPWGMLGGLSLGVLHAIRRLYGLVKREMAKPDHPADDIPSPDVKQSLDEQSENDDDRPSSSNSF